MMSWCVNITCKNDLDQINDLVPFEALKPVNAGVWSHWESDLHENKGAQSSIYYELYIGISCTTIQYVFIPQV